MYNSNIYTVGGTVQAGGGIYISRQADDELLALCRQRIFAYVLTSRQVGKSSLMVRTAEQLADEGIQSVIIDLTQLGVQVTAEEWYLGLLTIIADQLMLDTDVVEWWQSLAHLGITQRLTRFFQEILLVEVVPPMVLFVDEIDTTLSLDFTDDFFAAIRYLYNGRAYVPDFQRLSFVLIGVATPGDLIRDSKRTPFNIGQRVDLTDFTFEEALPLAHGLGLPTNEAQQVLKWVLNWTGGHPYLTQRLCRAITEQGKSSCSEADVECVVSNTFFGEMSKQDNNLQFVRDMLTKRAPDLFGVLTTYRDIRRSKRPVLDEEQSLVKSHLKLSGVVRRENTSLKIRNLIYRKVFDDRWVKENLQINWTKRLQRASVGLIAISVVSAFFGLYSFYATRQRIIALSASSETQLLSHQQLEALMAGLEAGKQVKNFIAVPTDVEYATLKSLGQAVFRIQELNRLEGHSKAVISVKFSPDGQTIASASDDQTLNLWRRDGKLLQTLKGHQSTVKDVTFSPDGKKIATASFDGTIKLWRTSDGALIKTINAHNFEVFSVSWSADGQIIASGSADTTIKIWRVSDGQLLKTLSGHSADVNSVSFSPQGNTIASGSVDKTIKIWRISDGQLLKTLTGHTDEVTSVAFSPQGNTIASGSVDKTIKIWNSDGTLQQTIVGHSAQVNYVTFSPDGLTLASASKDNTINLWNPKDGTLLQTFLGHSIAVYGVSFSPDSQTLASAGADQTVRLWQRDNSLVKTLLVSKLWVNSVSFNPNGNLLATASDDKTIKLWDIPSMTLRLSLEGLDKSPDGHNGGVYGVSFSPDGQTIASAGGEGWVKLWRTRDGYMIKTLVGHKNEVNNVTFSPKGDILASASADATIKLWRVSGGKLIRTLTGHNGEVFRISFSPKGDIIASASRDNTIKIWRVKDGKLLRTLIGHTSSVSGVTFNPQADILASASFDKTIKLWQVKNGKLLQTVKGHDDAVWGVSFSPDGQMIASASNDKTVKLWTKDGIEIKTFWGHSEAVSDVSFSPDGKMIASSSNDGTVKLWRIDSKELQTTDLDRLLIRGCRWLHDYLENNPKLSNQERDLCDGI
jgi:WD40 repeat protein